jgi:hypothetical protein
LPSELQNAWDHERHNVLVLDLERLDRDLTGRQGGDY